MTPLESLSLRVVANPFDVPTWREYIDQCRAAGETLFADLAER